MKFISYSVELYKDYGNRPVVEVTVDKLPENNELLYDQYEWCYFAEKDGYVSFFHYTNPSDGYGGRRFHIRMKDGSEKILIGPWSSRAGAVNSLNVFPPVVDVHFRTAGDMYASQSGHVTLKWLRDNGVPMIATNDRGECVYEPVDANGNLLKPLVWYE